jgi:hypothetical protein
VRNDRRAARSGEATKGMDADAMDEIRKNMEEMIAEVRRIDVDSISLQLPYRAGWDQEEDQRDE